MKEINIKHVAPIHQEWLRGLDFYLLELVILQERLEEIAGDNTGQETAEGIEHFQNQLIIHREQIDVLKHRIHENVSGMEVELEKGGSYIPEHLVTEYGLLQEQYHMEEKLVNELRKDFNRFAAKWM